ncbi:MAG: hypothetical protein ACE5Z5_01975 [Candidatus Bathyarchaeia archaeon]
MAGFTNSISGVWTYLEIKEGDFVSFLYGARAHNLYRVKKKEAIRDFENLPPWQPITFRESGRTYYFPFRLHLIPVRRMEESLVRPEFAYVAENLLLRGGYRKTHFQADQTTLQNASQMGRIFDEEFQELDLRGYRTFTPRFVRNRKLASVPEIFPLQEYILQTLIRRHLMDDNNLDKFLELTEIDELETKNLEILGEKALPEGHIDIIIKEAIPIGTSKKIILEVKTSRGSERDLNQLSEYVKELGDECIAGVLIAKVFSRKVIRKYGKQCKLKLMMHSFQDFSSDGCYTFEELLEKFRLKDVREEKLSLC